MARYALGPVPVQPVPISGRLLRAKATHLLSASGLKQHNRTETPLKTGCHYTTTTTAATTTTTTTNASTNCTAVPNLARCPAPTSRQDGPRVHTVL